MPVAAPHSRPEPARLATLAVLAVLAAGPAAAKPALVACELEHPLRLTVLPAECGTLEVAENPAQPAARRITLHFARVPAISRRKLADPLFILAGGPGASAIGFYAGIAGAFARIHRERDIILLDQRGTGASHPLSCGTDREPSYRASLTAIAADTRACLTRLTGTADPAYYTTSIAVRDLEALRLALGYPRINLYGTSYGTRVAQHYLRRYPLAVRSVILDGVVPVRDAIGPATALDAEAALSRILARCAAAPACAARYGDPTRTYRAVRAALDEHSVPVIIADPASGVPKSLEFGGEELATVLRLGSYSAEYAALLPLLLSSAAAPHPDYTPLAAQFLIIERAYGEALATGMHNSVVCAEDVPFYDSARIDRAALAATFLGTRQLDGLAAVCQVWPHGVIDADFHAPLTSAVPALLLSGSDDPVTPPAGAARALAGFARGRHLVLEGFGHGALTAPCVERLMAQFLDSGSAATLDTACLARARPQAFFTSVNGPAP